VSSRQTIQTRQSELSGVGLWSRFGFNHFEGAKAVTESRFLPSMHSNLSWPFFTTACSISDMTRPIRHPKIEREAGMGASFESVVLETWSTSSIISGLNRVAPLFFSTLSLQDEAFWSHYFNYQEVGTGRLCIFSNLYTLVSFDKSSSFASILSRMFR
jgi:hypothetical protein